MLGIWLSQNCFHAGDIGCHDFMIRTLNMWGFIWGNQPTWSDTIEQESVRILSMQGGLWANYALKLADCSNWGIIKLDHKGLGQYVLNTYDNLGVELDFGMRQDKMNLAAETWIGSNYFLLNEGLVLSMASASACALCTQSVVCFTWNTTVYLAVLTCSVYVDLYCIQSILNRF